MQEELEVLFKLVYFYSELLNLILLFLAVSHVCDDRVRKQFEFCQKLKIRKTRSKNIDRSSMSDSEEVQTQEPTLFVSPIADPLMAGKLYSKTLKLVRKAAEAKAIRRGVPDVIKAIRKGQKGYVK